ncbi:MAG TPA: hypothetical protein VHS58_10700 [Acetobacteraceae bacterium]|jgi:hypothetical protein|nr:hypothetical protein [Acetobacteraceae bacterium]
MDFIEQWFGVSPDGGDGTLEVFWLVAIVVAVLAIVFRRRLIRMLSARSSDRR